MRATTFVLIASFLAPVAWGAPAGQKTFKTPEAAVQALVKAAQAKDTKALLSVLGPDSEPLINSGDPVADKNSRDGFLAGYRAGNSLDKSVQGQVTLEVGEDRWPFPIPLIQEGAVWYFDSAAGADELVNRRIGENELSTIQSCLAYVDAQREFYVRNAQNDPLLHFANKLVSGEGKKDGLYWPTSGAETPSPMGEIFAEARAEGYLQPGSAKGQPYHGYIYRQLVRQGPDAPGGAYEYLVNGELLGGHALVAFPADYGNSGVMTFIVNHDGVVYSRNLGPHTREVAMGMAEFNPDSLWKKEDADVLAAQ